MLIILLIGDCNLWVVLVKKIVLNLFILEVIWYVSLVCLSFFKIFFSFLELEFLGDGIIEEFDKFWFLCLNYNLLVINLNLNFNVKKIKLFLVILLKIVNFLRVF